MTGQPGDRRGQPDGRRRWRLQEQLEASGPERRWFATLAALLAVVSIWRGTWLLMDLYVFPSSPLLSAGTSIILGLLLLFAAGRSLDEAL